MSLLIFLFVFFFYIMSKLFLSPDLFSLNVLYDVACYTPFLEFK